MSLRVAILLALAACALARNACPDAPARAVNSAAMPADVCIPTGFTDVPVTFFDEYSWRAFVAMVWPSARRGGADAAKTVGGAGARVFETYRQLWEVFHDDGSAPNPDFQKYEDGKHNACKVTPGFGDVVLAAGGVADIGQAAAGELGGPLAAQNGRYLRYQTLYNQTAFDFIVQSKLWQRSALPEVPSPKPVLPVVQFPNGSVAVKAAWVEMEGLPAELRARFYTRMAVVRDPETGKCGRVTVGLAGLHIAQKTASRPQWIWSSFEQVDVTPPARMNAPGKFLLHDGSAAEMPAENPLPLEPLAKTPARAFNVVRSVPIHPKTAVANLMYERLLAGTVWANYQLVVTQWPRLEGDQSVPVPAAQNGDASNTFPGIGATSAWANLTMETFDQGRVQLGCMSCHNQARLAGDFMWSVLDHAWPGKKDFSTQKTDSPQRR